MLNATIQGCGLGTVDAKRLVQLLLLLLLVQQRHSRMRVPIDPR